MTADNAGELCAGREFQSWLLDMLAWSIGVDLSPPSPPVSIALEAAPLNESAPGAADPAVGSASSQNTPFDDRATGNLQAQIIPLTPKAIVELTLTQTLSTKLKKWHKRVISEGLHFDKLDIEARHELRKRAKRLRYCLQFCESLLPENRLKQYRKSLAVVQDVLGEMNDLAVASERFEGLKTTQPHAWFAVGWIASRLEVLTRDAMKAFKDLSGAERFWR
jgi:hypothetical protein